MVEPTKVNPLFFRSLADLIGQIRICRNPGHGSESILNWLSTDKVPEVAVKRQALIQHRKVDARVFDKSIDF